MHLAVLGLWFYLQPEKRWRGGGAVETCEILPTVYPSLDPICDYHEHQAHCTRNAFTFDQSKLS